MSRKDGGDEVLNPCKATMECDVGPYDISYEGVHYEAHYCSKKPISEATWVGFDSLCIPKMRKNIINGNNIGF